MGNSLQNQLKKMNVFENDTELISQADILCETMDMPKLRVEYEEWYSQVHRITSLVIPERVDDLEDAYKGISNYLITHLSYPGQGSRQIFQAQLEQQKGILRAAFSAGYIHKNNKSSEEIVESIFDRFHVVAKQFEERHDNRPTIAIEDEYDVQDLLHGLLKLYFDDIRPEEWTPSYAGCSSRGDFLLKNEKMVIEVKKTRPNLLDREIGEQLIIDIHKYRSHPSCKTLLCFVYDPDQLISNPDGLENDLNKEHDNLRVLVKVVPKRA